MNVDDRELGISIIPLLFASGESQFVVKQIKPRFPRWIGSI